MTRGDDVINNRQVWTTIILSFVLLLLVVVGSFAYGSLKEVSKIVQSPAATSKIDIDADIMLEASQDGELQLQYIRFNRIQGELNSKIIDLILIGLSK